MGTLNHRRSSFWSKTPILIALTLLLSACPKPPQEALDAAEAAVLAAEGRKDCAGEKFAAAEALLEEARAHVAAEEYEAAERKARAAERLAREAQEQADETWEDCQRRLEAARRAAEGGTQTQPTEVEQETPEEDLKLTTVLFPYNSAEISETSRQALETNLRWLRQNPDATILLEGHTDERGTSEFNVALGERRARFVRDYLVQRGIEAERLSTLSYGEEKPVAFGQSEDDFARNRRVEFLPR
ncbi:OmpA family protein [Lujinxingia vulgaris]|uniref:Peptidoglycan-associated lipoprotein n=1 Tax=Lujinxingia vulgaris TaxID=2600176 RepID=A0A5C6XP98_9DELT|nr:OmpA family protein [Lujinxingia vulgaris]TXD39432.1 OmpA family protein [Lujinxingia vulgaris]